MNLKDIDIKNRVNRYSLLSILIGTIVGLLSIRFCIYFNLAIFGFNIYIIFSPVIAGFVETYISQKLINRSSGAISSIIIFVFTNVLNWIFPLQPITWNIFTIGGLLLMIQAAIPLTINYIILGLFFLLTYVFGIVGGFLATTLHKNEVNTPINTTSIEEGNDLNIIILNNKPDIPIDKYHGLIFAEEVIRFVDKKDHIERLNFLGSELDKKNLIKNREFVIAKEYIFKLLEEEALKVNANAIIDIEIEYTNYNQHLPPDILIAAYGTAVTIDEKYLN